MPLGELIGDCIAGVLGFVVVSWLFMRLFIKKPKLFFSWLIRNKYWYIISLALAFVNIALVIPGFDIESLIFAPIIVLTYAFISMIGFAIYWGVKGKGKDKV